MYTNVWLAVWLITLGGNEALQFTVCNRMITDDTGFGQNGQFLLIKVLRHIGTPGEVGNV